jgi:hypothetical protein
LIFPVLPWGNPHDLPEKPGEIVRIFYAVNSGNMLNGSIGRKNIPGGGLHFDTEKIFNRGVSGVLLEKMIQMGRT